MFFVALGIFFSRISGLVRERIFAHFFGNSDAGDAFKAALKIPNFLQNLFGEGVLSASFIPVYAKLLAEKNEEEARKLALAILSLLSVVVSILVALGVLLTPWLIALIAPGFNGEKRELTVEIVRLLFPGTGLLVISAWCLGILNSHRRFFLSYVAPVLWNLAIIAALVFYGHQQSQSSLAVTAAWGLLLGSLLQTLVQVPTCVRLLKKITWHWDLKSGSARTVIKNFFPVVTGRGVVQVSAYVDNIIASWLPTGAVSALAYAQTLYLLPVSLFGMSVSASELPAMSQAVGSEEEIKTYLHKRLKSSLRKLSFFILPSAVAFIALGEDIVALVFQTGEFDSESSRYVWLILAAYSLGLWATTQARLFSSAFYSLKDPKTPLRCALVRVAIALGLGVFLALWGPRLLGVTPTYGAIGLGLAAGIAGICEFFILRYLWIKKMGTVSIDFSFLAKLLTATLVAAAAAMVLKSNSIFAGFWLNSLSVVLLYGSLYLGLTWVFKVEETTQIAKKILRR